MPRAYAPLGMRFRQACERRRNKDGTVGAPCHRCGKSLDYRLTVGPWAFVADSAVRRPRFADLRPAHAVCVRKDVHSPADGDTGESSEAW
jgi:hypothetical protein